MGSFDTKNPCNLTVEEQEQLQSFLRGNFSFNGKTLFKGKVDANTVTALSIVDGAVIASKLTLGTQNWTTDIVFSPTDNDTVAWTSGHIITSDGLNEYFISSGNTGNMAAFTYIFFDTAISLTVLQVTTDYTKVTSDTAILLCVASFIADATQLAFYIPAIGTFGINSTIIGQNSISTSKIQALAITTGLLSAGAVTAAKINVATLDAIAVNAGTITAGTFIGTTFETATSGSRVVIDSTNGLRAYDTGGVLQTQIAISGAFGGYISTPQVYGKSGALALSDSTTVSTILIGSSSLAFTANSTTYLSISNLGIVAQSCNFVVSSGFGLAFSGQSIALGTNIAMYVSSTVQATFTSTELQLSNKLWVGSSPPSGFGSFHQAWFNGGVVVPNGSGYCTVMPDGVTVRFLYNLSGAGNFILGQSSGTTPGTDALNTIQFKLPTITTPMILDRTNDPTNTCMQLYWNGALHRVAFDGTQLYLV